MLEMTSIKWASNFTADFQHFDWRHFYGRYEFRPRKIVLYLYLFLLLLLLLFFFVVVVVVFFFFFCYFLHQHWLFSVHFGWNFAKNRKIYLSLEQYSTYFNLFQIFPCFPALIIHRGLGYLKDRNAAANSVDTDIS